MWPKVLVNAIHQGNVTLKGGQTFNSVGYVRMMVRRTELLNELLQSGISFVLFETDFVWFENPVPDFVELAFKDSLDLVGTKSAAPEQIMCGGFIYFRKHVSHARSVGGSITSDARAGCPNECLEQQRQES